MPCPRPKSRTRKEMANIFITGVNRGIGLALVKEFLKMCNVGKIIGTCRDPTKAEELNKIKDPRLHIVKLEATSDKSIQDAYKEVEKIVGASGINLLINNAGVMLNYGTIREPDRGLISEQFDVNVISVVLVTQYFLPLVRLGAKSSAGAKIINISSNLGSCQGPYAASGSAPKGYLAYRMTKTAINSMSKCMGVDLAPEGITVAAFAPGWIQTDLGGGNAPLKLEDAIPPLAKAFFALKKEQAGGFYDRFLKPVEY